MTTVALAHDYLTQRGGAERVVLAMLKAFPGAPLYTSLYEPELTFPEFKEIDVRTTSLNRLRALRRNHRLALPLLPSAFSRLRIQADVTICSSSGWAHGVLASGKKIVYCHTPAKWLYQPDLYFGARRGLQRIALARLRPWLVRWDRRAARSASRYLVPSREVRARVMDRYRIEAQVLPGPSSLDPRGPTTPVDGVTPGFALCVSRLLPYKNIDILVHAFQARPGQLVIVGDGPDKHRLLSVAPGNVKLLGAVSDEQLRWLYSGCSCVLCPSYEDYGLIPIEAAAFGKPVVALRWGGFLDTVVENETGVFFDAPTTDEVTRALDRWGRHRFDHGALLTHAARFSESQFISHLRALASPTKQAT